MMVVSHFFPVMVGFVYMTWDCTAKEYMKQAKSDPIWDLERQILYGRGKKAEQSIAKKISSSIEY